jgi:hypothetical protein
MGDAIDQSAHMAAPCRQRRGRSLTLVEFLDHAISDFDLQGEGLFEQAKQHLAMFGVVAFPLELGQKRQQRIDALLAFLDTPIGGLEALAGDLSVERADHRTKTRHFERGSQRVAIRG